MTMPTGRTTYFQFLSIPIKNKTFGLGPPLLLHEKTSLTDLCASVSPFAIFDSTKDLMGVPSLHGKA